jgi:spermidine/putrescine transport system permease protein
MTRLHYALWVIVALWTAAVLVPVGSLLIWSFLHLENYRFVWSAGTDAYLQLLESGRYEVIVTTLRIAATITLIELAVALPVALWLAKGVKSPAAKAMSLALLTIPFFISLASRTMVFRPVLGRSGLINTMLLDLGLIDRPLDSLLFSEFAVHLGLLGPFFPTMVLPIFMAIALIDDDLIEASRDLGANSRKVFTDVILPLATPGIVAGIIFTFVPMLGETVVPQLLGGSNVSMLGGSIASLVQVLNYPVAAALSVIVLLILAALLGVMSFVAPRHISIGAAFEGLKR